MHAAVQEGSCLTVPSLFIDIMGHCFKSERLQKVALHSQGAYRQTCSDDELGRFTHTEVG